MSDTPLTLLALNGLISATIAGDKHLQNVWIVAETGDLRVSGGHCYMELLEKDASNGRPVARIRAIIWASQYASIASRFALETGQQLASDLKVMVRVTVNFHPAFGLSAVITDINPEFTCGDLLRRRRMMIERLTAEGIIDMNRTLRWSDTTLRVAVISAQGAAGYGDFITHLYTNPSRLRFATTLFSATMQGDNAPASIIAALEAIAADEDSFDCVAIIRGGGATGDLASFDNYELAANIAQFPLPVIVGIGHERDVTLLDYVAAVRVKTPTAAAEWLIAHNENALDKVREIASEIFREATAKVSGSLQQLAYYQGLLPTLAIAKLDKAKTTLGSAIPDALQHYAEAGMRRQRDKLDAISQLISVLSPEAVLKRGYSISRIDGHAISDISEIRPGTEISTTTANGTFISTVTKTFKKTSSCNPSTN